MANVAAKLEIVTSPLPPHSELQLSQLKSATPLVSVVIPVYNGSKYIQIAINSVLRQTYSNYEIVVIDDGSTDDTRQKLQPYQAEINYVFQKNLGSAAARNIGISLAKGELIAFLDADDFWTMPEKLAKQVACFYDNPTLGCVNTGWRIIDGSGKHIKTVQPWHKAPKLDLETWLRKKCVRTSAMMFRREWLEKVGGFDQELRQSHDVDLILRLSLAGCETVWLKEETVGYRQHESNTTRNSLKQAKYVQAVLDKFFSRNDLPIAVRQMESRTRYHTLVWLAWYQYRADNLDEMVKLLSKSLDFTPYLRVENISHWLTNFSRFSQDRGEECNIDSLTNTFQWHQLIALTLGLKNLVNQNVFEKAQNRENKQDNDADIQNLKEAKKSQEIGDDLPKQDKTNNNISKKAVELDLTLQQAQRTDESYNSFSRQNESFSVSENTNSCLKENVNLAESFYRKRQFKEAIKHYRQAVQIQPDDWNIRYKLGYVLFRSKLWKESIIECRKSIELKPDFLWSYYNLGRNLAQIGQEDKAITSYLKALEIEYNFEIGRQLDLLLNKKISYYRDRLRDEVEAPKFYRELIEIKQSLLTKEIALKAEKVQQYKELGDKLSKDGKLNEAAKFYRKAIELQPNDWSFHQRLSHVLLKQRKWNESISECRKVIDLNPNFIWSYYNLGRNFYQIGNWEEAISCYLNALKISYKPEIQKDLELLLEEKIDYYQSSLQHDLENLTHYQKLLDIKGKIKVAQYKKSQQKSQQILSGFSKEVEKRKRILCLMFGMQNFEFTESINYILHHMYENKIYPIVFTDSVKTELLFKNNVIFEYFPLLEKPSKFSDSQWEQYFQARVSNLVKEWSPQNVLNFNNTLNRKLSHTLLSIA